jgi:hypothetical protein
MPRRVESDEEEPKSRKRKGNAIKKQKTTTRKSTAASKKTKPVQKESDSVISGWATRRAVESLDGIEDVDSVTPRKERRKLAFEVDDGMSFICSG